MKEGSVRDEEERKSTMGQNRSDIDSGGGRVDIKPIGLLVHSN